MNIFFEEDDRRDYLQIMQKQAELNGIKFLGYCLMTNHVHHIVVPEFETSLSSGIGEAHRAYARAINERLGVRGHLFQERFWSSVLGETHLLYALRYVELNSVRGGLVAHAADYPWSSARFHLGLIDHDPLVMDRTAEGLVSDWRDVLYEDEECDYAQIRQATRKGGPCGSETFVEMIRAMIASRSRRRRRDRQE